MYNEMTVTEFKEYVKQPEITDRILEMRSGRAKVRVNGKPSFICPICKHGQNGDGLTHIPAAPELLKCFGKCNGKTGDVIQFFQEADGKDFLEEIKTLADLLGITIKANTPASDPFTMTFTGHELDNEARANQEKEENTMTATTQAAPAKYGEKTDYTEYYKQCYARIRKDGENEKAISYLQSRGISLNTALLHGIGYDPTADPANAPGALDGQGKPHPAARLIIPCDAGYYTTRAIDEAAVPKGYWKMNARGNGEKMRHINIPNEAYTAEYIFICEGIFDAMSITEATRDVWDDDSFNGRDNDDIRRINIAAIALNSVVYAGELLAEFEKHRPAGVVLLALDNDKAGKAATEKIAEGLKRLTIPHAEADIAKEWESICGVTPEGKDPNEMLIENTGLFSLAIEERLTAIRQPDGIARYINGGGYDKDIKNIIPPIPTGFEKLDKESGGGIRTELYVLSAPSSIGKTTFCLQLACNLATAGRNVLYFAMEQSRLELVNKCIARESCEINPNKAITAMEAGSPQAWQAETAKEARETLAKKIGNRLSIIEWNLDATTAALKDYILAYIKYNKCDARPIVIIDYLQLIQGIEINGRTQQIREVMNDTISEMKRMSRAYNIPIICIASQARACYGRPFEMGNIKETGNIEYTAGIVWGLQFTEIEERANDKTYSPELKKLKLENPRKVTLTCDKNRGCTGVYQVNFDYYPAYDYFTESKNQEISGFNIKF